MQLTSAEGRDSIALYGKLSFFSDPDVSLQTNLKKHSTLIEQSSGFQVALERMNYVRCALFFQNNNEMLVHSRFYAVAWLNNQHMSTTSS